MADAPQQWYAIIDCAQDPRLGQLVRSCRAHMCLYKGDLDPQIADVAPYLVVIDPNEPLLATWQEHGKGGNWGLMLLSSLSLEDLQKHFRKFMQAKLPDGTVSLFRFYDPRVFNSFIRSATDEERKPWFKGIRQYSVEAEDGAGHFDYKWKEGKLLMGDQALA
ncbi:hypothetical protein GCM10011371_20830 [Novosphingobium marinum]|uniref:DUF4123 domain-containing protein n=1 Tax=Novosphingobium marinum TaxID=1514948 RepID=A0A7Y9XZI2_9SPHN|nr:DUF4123 domain-containing protein [Novosphingobium marinum]NYH96195.1 hypothetical protein [Novosphingobium marinum]GGC33228.1 hypothetical protein GCM10011371_20830 [Novosphingobium marinum]